MRLLWFGILALLAAGGVLFTAEGMLIALWRVWFNPEASLFLRLMLPATVIAFAAVIAATAWTKRQQQQQRRPAAVVSKDDSR